MTNSVQALLTWYGSVEAHVNRGHRRPAGLPLTMPTTNPGSTSAMTSTDHGLSCMNNFRTNFVESQDSYSAEEKNTDITRFHIVYCSW